MILCCYNVILKDRVETGRFTIKDVTIVDDVTNINIYVSKKPLRSSLETLLKDRRNYLIKNLPKQSDDRVGLFS